MRFNFIELIKGSYIWFYNKNKSYSRLIILISLGVAIYFIFSSGDFVAAFLGAFLLLTVALLVPLIERYITNFKCDVEIMKDMRFRNVNLPRSTSPFLRSATESLGDVAFYIFQDFIFHKYLTDNEVRRDAVLQSTKSVAVDYKVCKDCGVNKIYDGKCPFSYCLACDDRLMFTEEEMKIILKYSKNEYLEKVDNFIEFMKGDE